MRGRSVAWTMLDRTLKAEFHSFFICLTNQLCYLFIIYLLILDIRNKIQINLIAIITKTSRIIYVLKFDTLTTYELMDGGANLIT